MENINYLKDELLYMATQPIYQNLSYGTVIEIAKDRFFRNKGENK